MDTDHLIAALAADGDTRIRRVGAALALAIAIALPVSVAMFLAALGPRPDIMTAMHDPFFDLKFIVTLALAATAIALSLRLSRPEAAPRGWAWLLLIPFGILALGILGEMMVPQSRPWLARLVGANAPLCLLAIPALSLPLLAATLLALRHGAPRRPALAGAVAGLASAGLAATLYASHCTDNSPMFVAMWYPIAAAIVAAIGAVAGAKLLRY